MSANTVLITESRFPYRAIREFISKQGVRVYSLDGTISGHDREIGLIEGLDIWKIWSKAYLLARRWYKPNGEDATRIGDISFGTIIEIEMWYFWREILEKTELLRSIFNTISPEEVFLATFKNDELERIVIGLQGSGIKIKKISVPFTSLPHVFRDGEFVRNRLKNLEIDRYIRSIALTFSKVYGRNQRNLLSPHDQQQADKAIEVLALLEQPGDYLAESILPVLSLFPRSAVLLMDPRHLERAKAEEREVLFFSDVIIKHLASLNRYRGLFKERWDKARIPLSTSLSDDGLNLWPIVEKRIRRVFNRKFPFLGVEVESARELLIKRQVKSLLLPSDAHHGGRLLTLIANQIGIPSLVVQHGATLGEWGYIPLYATRFAAWGNISRDWLIKRGVPPERIIVCGQPRLDREIGRSSERSRDAILDRLGFPNSGFLLLWAMDPIPKSENQMIFQQLTRLVESFSWLNLIIRPHPGIQQIIWIETLARDQERVMISSAREDLYDVLHVVDAIIIQGSTVGIEAIMYDKPVVNFQPNSAGSGFNTFYAGNAVIAASTFEELLGALDMLHNIKDGKSIDRYAHARREYIREYFHALDGQSSMRVAQALSGLLAESETSPKMLNQ